MTETNIKPEKPDINKGMHPILTDDGDEVLTLREVARILKASTKQVYELTRSRGQARSAIPLPVFTIHSKMKRVRKSDLRTWLNSLIDAQTRKQK
ncbi:MAG: helix-turn-helix domain-containing protein [Candidatus Sulfotelmatobacter sp.]